MGIVSVMGVMMAESSGILDRQGGKPNQHQPLLLAKTRALRTPSGPDQGDVISSVLQREIVAWHR
jgi:hypothetical protein